MIQRKSSTAQKPKSTVPQRNHPSGFRMRVVAALELRSEIKITNCDPRFVQQLHAFRPHYLPKII